MEKKINNQRFLKFLVKILKTLGVCACAYMILSVLANYGQPSEKLKEEPKRKIPSTKDAQEIIEAKIET